jgi:hypothetical protein
MKISIGATYPSKFCGDFEVIDLSGEKATIKFKNTDTVVAVDLHLIRKRAVIDDPYSKHHPNSEHPYGIGFQGEGPYKVYERNKITKLGSKWITALKNVVHGKYTLCEEWKNFQNFCDWALTQDGWDQTLIVLAGETEYNPYSCFFGTFGEMSSNSKKAKKMALEAKEKNEPKDFEKILTSEWIEAKLMFKTLETNQKDSMTADEMFEGMMSLLEKEGRETVITSPKPLISKLLEKKVIITSDDVNYSVKYEH